MIHYVNIIIDKIDYYMWKNRNNDINREYKKRISVVEHCNNITIKFKDSIKEEWGTVNYRYLRRDFDIEYINKIDSDIIMSERGIIIPKKYIYTGYD